MSGQLATRQEIDQAKLLGHFLVRMTEACERSGTSLKGESGWRRTGVYEQPIDIIAVMTQAEIDAQLHLDHTDMYLIDEAKRGAVEREVKRRRNYVYAVYLRLVSGNVV